VRLEPNRYLLKASGAWKRKIGARTPQRVGLGENMPYLALFYPSYDYGAGREMSALFLELFSAGEYHEPPQMGPQKRGVRVRGEMSFCKTSLPLSCLFGRPSQTGRAGSSMEGKSRKPSTQGGFDPLEGARDQRCLKTGDHFLLVSRSAMSAENMKKPASIAKGVVPDHDP